MTDRTVWKTGDLTKQELRERAKAMLARTSYKVLRRNFSAKDSYEGVKFYDAFVKGLEIAKEKRRQECKLKS